MYTKISIKSNLKNLTENNIYKHHALAIKNKNKISYKVDEEKYILKQNSPTSLIIERTTPSIISNLYFEKNKITESTYYIKENDITLYIKTQTNELKIKDNNIYIKYTILDSNNDYEYTIEMSGENE